MFTPCVKPLGKPRPGLTLEKQRREADPEKGPSPFLLSLSSHTQERDWALGGPQTTQLGEATVQGCEHLQPLHRGAGTHCCRDHHATESRAGGWPIWRAWDLPLTDTILRRGRKEDSASIRPQKNPTAEKGDCRTGLQRWSSNPHRTPEEGEGA